MIEVTGSPPYPDDVASRVIALAEEALEMGDIDQMKVVWCLDDQLEITSRDVLFQSKPFDEWFELYYADNSKYWDDSYVVVYSDTVPGRDELRFHVVLGEDMPVYALCVNRKTRMAQWYLQETPTARRLAATRE